MIFFRVLIKAKTKRKLIQKKLEKIEMIEEEFFFRLFSFIVYLLMYVNFMIFFHK